MKRTFFSVIVPLYNKADYIEKALQSVLAQTYTDFELIVVDDGSTDNSLQVVQSIQQLSTFNFQLLTETNAGVSTARNNGAKVAKGDYLAFLDADDWWEPTFLDEMRVLVDEFPEAGIYGSSYYKVKNNQHIPANIGVNKDFERGIIHYFQVYARTLWMPLWTGSTLYQRKYLKKRTVLNLN